MEAMDLSKIMAQHNFRSWYMKINAIISKYGFAHIMECPVEINHRQFLSEFGQRCEDSFVQDWHASLGNDLHRRHGGRNKLRTYRKFKHNFEWEPYLTIVKSPPLKTALCKFRISCRLLEIERQISETKFTACRPAVLSKLSTAG